MASQAGAEAAMTDLASTLLDKRHPAFDEDFEIGPAMKALSSRHRDAVRALFDNNGNRTAALRQCGYGGSPKNLNSHASKFFSDRRIRAAIKEECLSRIDICEPELIALTMKMAKDKKTRPADRLRAIAMCWDRSNPVMTRHKLEVEHHLSSDERDVQHYLALKKIGAPADAFLRRFGANGIARVEALVLAEDARRRQLDGGETIEGECEEVASAG
jgi:hypothetical protein